MRNLPICIRRCELEKIALHAREGYPYEVVGLLAGCRQRKAVVKTERLVNERADRPQDRYLVSGLEVLRAERFLRQEGLEPVGYYHSHPDHSARYSHFDLEEAHLGMSYLIVSVDEGGVVEMLSWRLADDRTRMEPENIEMED